jgi:hypothetical protein
VTHCLQVPRPLGLEIAICSLVMLACPAYALQRPSMQRYNKIGECRCGAGKNEVDPFLESLGVLDWPIPTTGLKCILSRRLIIKRPRQ